MRQLAPCAVLILATLAVAGEACAQQRTLSWAGRPAAAAAVAAAAPAPDQARLASSGLIPHAGVDAGPPTGVAPMPLTPDRVRRPGLTPADIWLPASAASAPPPIASPVTAPVTATAAAAAPVQPPAPPPGSAAAAATPAPEARAGLVEDAPSVSTIGQTPAPNGGRYYSVHRQNGRQPDTIQRPEPVYLDGLPVQFTDPGQSGLGEDLAAPPAATPMVRDSNGRLRPAPAAVEHDIP